LSGHRSNTWIRQHGVSLTPASARRWNPNIQTKTYYLASENRRIKLRVSAKGIKVIDRDGIDAVVARLHRRGEKI
jgi:large subunit ribosomal protein L28